MISIRPGEKSHEILINRDELRKTFETKEDYVIYEKQIQNQEVIKSQGLVETNRTDEYSSDKVISLTKNEIKDILKQENLLP
jgi:UDP-N-acetylglucosamine 4,6-dehydratase/UDP-glucose 4-epimerase